MSGAAFLQRQRAQSKNCRVKLIWFHIPLVLLFPFLFICWHFSFWALNHKPSCCALKSQPMYNVIEALDSTQHSLSMQKVIKTWEIHNNTQENKGIVEKPSLSKDESWMDVTQRCLQSITSKTVKQWLEQSYNKTGWYISVTFTCICLPRGNKTDMT